MADLAGRVLLITGASRGFGAAVAQTAAAAGASTVLCARDVRALEALADDIEARGGVAPVLAPINLESATSADYALIARLLAERFDRLDGLLLNAAMLGELAPLGSYDAVTWARVFQVNVHSPFLMLQALLPMLTRAARAAVVFTLAGEGLRGHAHFGAYGASKHALHGLFATLAAEYAGRPGLGIHAVLPPPMRTRLRATAYPAEDPRRLPEPASLVAPCVELLAGDARGAHGQVVALP